MTIAINTRILSGNTAISKILIDYFIIIAANNPEHEFIFITEKDFTKANNTAKNIKKIVLPQQSNNPLLWKLWYNYKLPAVLKKYKAAVLITADGVCLRTKVPQCLLINDLAFLHHPEWYPQKYGRFMKSNMPAFLNKAKNIVTFSYQLKNEIVTKYKVSEHKIMVLNTVTNKSYQPVEWDAREPVKEKYAEGKEYFLFNGAIHQSSSLVNLLKAFSLFKKRQKSNMQLIIATNNIPDKDPFVESLKLYKYRNDIKLLAALDEAALQNITAAAYACINLSPLYMDIAGLLNAMQCEVPVIANNTGVATEILGGAALYISPSNIDSIAEKLMLVYKDENRRKELIQKGLQQSAKYNANENAGQLWQNIFATIECP